MSGRDDILLFDIKVVCKNCGNTDNFRLAHIKEGHTIVEGIVIKNGRLFRIASRVNANLNIAKMIVDNVPVANWFKYINQIICYNCAYLFSDKERLMSMGTLVEKIYFAYKHGYYSLSLFTAFREIRISNNYFKYGDEEE